MANAKITDMINIFNTVLKPAQQPIKINQLKILSDMEINN